MANNCPSVPFGIPSGGATEYDINTGRELFRCGTGCVKMYITNVSGEKRTVTISCDSIDDAVVTVQGAAKMCLQSANVNLRDQAVVNWGAKSGVTSDLASGSVITKVAPCAGSSGVIYTHTEGNLSVRVLAAVNVLTDETATNTVKTTALNKLGHGDVDVDWILSDIGVNVSPTDWQGGTVTFMGFGSAGTSTRQPKTYRASFNWQNGRKEVGEGTITYDSTDEKNPSVVFKNVLGLT